METRYKLGWLPDVPDTRDIPFAAVFRIPRKLPARADLRAGCSPVEDQENLGSCTAQALVGALDFLELSTVSGSASGGKFCKIENRQFNGSPLPILHPPADLLR